MVKTSDKGIACGSSRTLIQGLHGCISAVSRAERVFTISERGEGSIILPSTQKHVMGLLTGYRYEGALLGV